MRHFRYLFLGLFFFWWGAWGVVAHANSSQEANPPASKSPFKTDEFLVKFRTAPVQSLLSIQKLNTEYQVLTMEPVFQNLGSATSSDEIRKSIILKFKNRSARASNPVSAPELSTVYRMKVKPGADIQKMCKAYQKDPNVVYAQPNYVYLPNEVPNDPFYFSSNSWGQGYDDLWGLKKIAAEQAWDISKGDGIVVAVVDTGIDDTHPDLAANIWINENEIPGNGIDDDQNGFVDDVKGYDFYNFDNNPIDDYGHGTHIAGTIAAIGNNEMGIIGVAPHAKVMAVRGMSGSGGYASDLAEAIIYAANNGADVINMSWAGSDNAQVLLDAIQYAYAAGCILVAAASSNGYDTSLAYPSAYSEVASVGASDENDQKLSFSASGAKLEVVAPGGSNVASQWDNILSLLAANSSYSHDSSRVVQSKYFRTSGTSMAAPHVSGAVALILSPHPNFTQKDVLQILRASADDVNDPGFDISTGYGRLNVGRALQIQSVPKVEITTPIMHATVMTNTAPLAILGNAYGAGFVRYGLSYRPLLSLEWTTIRGGVLTPVQNGVLGTWDVSHLGVKTYLLKLEVTTQDGRKFSDIKAVHIEGKIIRITSNEASQTSPATDHQLIVWQDARNHDSPDIYAYDVSKGIEFPISTAVGSQEAPLIDGSRIVWTDNRNAIGQGLSDAYAYDITTGTEERLTPTARKWLFAESLEGDRLVWTQAGSNGKGDEYVYDFVTKTDRAFASTTAEEQSGHISQNQIAYRAVYTSPSIYSDVYVYDLISSASRNLTSGFPAVYRSWIQTTKNWVLWHQSDNNLLRIHIYDLNTSQERVMLPTVTPNQSSSSPAVWDHFVVYQDSREGVYNIFRYDLLTGEEIQITSSFVQHVDPDIGPNYIVWSDDRSGNNDIFAAENVIILPPAPIVTDEGILTNDTTGLKASWTSVTPQIVEYQYQVIDNPPSGQRGPSLILRDWTSTGTANSVTLTGLNLTRGRTYVFNVKAKSISGLWSEVGYSDGITVNTSPTCETVLPASGISLVGQTVYFAATYADSNGATNLGYVHLLVNTKIDGANSVFVMYTQNDNKLWLKNNNNTTWMGGFTPGSAKVIENAYVKLDCSKTTIAFDKNRLIVKWAVSFKPTFLGSKNLYLFSADDFLMESGWNKFGTTSIQLKR
jgi:beta propeller repeat protein